MVFSAKSKAGTSDEKWIRLRAGHEAEFLAAPESSSLTDYASYSNIAKLKPSPADQGPSLLSRSQSWFPCCRWFWP
jgi:hypothetical protein